MCTFLINSLFFLFIYIKALFIRWNGKFLLRKTCIAGEYNAVSFAYMQVNNF